MKIVVKYLVILVVVVLCPLPTAAAATPPAKSSIALISKVILDVSRKEVGKVWQTAKRGETLSSGDKVKTGVKSIAVIKFKDNSLVRVREKTVLTVTGQMKGTAFSKTVTMEKGVIGFNIKKQQLEEEFRFKSPTSVASIRGTGGQFTTREIADTLIVIEGNVRLTNNISSDFVDVEAGFTGISNADGTIQKRPSTQAERAAAENAMRVGKKDSRLEFELRDGQGNRKRLRIDFDE